MKFNKINLYNIILFLAMLLGTNPLIGQIASKNSQKKDRDTIQSSITLDDFDSFKNLFEVWNVGNLHVFANMPNNDKVEYYFEGKVIDDKFKKYLPIEVQRAMVFNEQTYYAIGIIRGANNENFYLVRENSPQTPNQLVLYKSVNNQLQAKKVIAYFKTKNNKKYFQLDTWIQDLNGDTYLDLIQRYRKITKSGKIMKVKTKVFLLSPNGSFNTSKEYEIEEGDYQFQDLK